MNITESLEEITKNYNCEDIDAIVVEGYDGVGKGKVLEYLSEYYKVVPYRPDYNMWQDYDHRKEDRWKVSGFFWDVFSHFGMNTMDTIMLFDRGVISGAVYNHDISIAHRYKEMIRDSRILHILVTCSVEDFKIFQKLRNPNISDFEIGYRWNDCISYTEEYIRSLEAASVDYIVYNNKFIASDAENSMNTCRGCGHYSYGVCRHPEINKFVDPNQKRCKNSNDVETQDMEVGMSVPEMQCL